MTDPFKIIEPTVISFSGGRTSAYLLWRVLQSNNGLPDDARAVFANTGKEDEATLKFIKDCSDKWNVNIDWVEYIPEEPKFKVVDFNTASRNGEPFEAVIRYYNKLPNPAQRWCTGILKIRTIHKFVRSLGWEHHETENSDFIGIRADEERRAAKQPREKVPLYTAGINKQDISKFWSEQDFELELPVIDGETIGGNCDLCFLKALPKVVSLIQQKPERAVWWAKMESLFDDKEGYVKGTGNKFRRERPSYAELIKFQGSQDELFNDETIPCFCGD